jgi:hypothetical protein
MALLNLTPQESALMTDLEAPMESAFADGTLMPGGNPPIIPPYEGWNKLKDEHKVLGKNAFKSVFGAFVSLIKSASFAAVFRANGEALTNYQGTPTPITNFENGFGLWGDGNYSLGQVRYYKDLQGWVHVEGLVRTPASSGHAYQSMFTLPVGFRPAPLDAQIFACVHNDGFCPIQMGYDGTVVIRMEPVPSGWVSVNIHFRAGG